MKRVNENELNVEFESTRDVVMVSENGKRFEMYADCEDDEALEKLLSVCPELDKMALRAALQLLHEDAEKNGFAVCVEVPGYWLDAEYCEDDACFIAVRKEAA